MPEIVPSPAETMFFVWICTWLGPVVGMGFFPRSEECGDWQDRTRRPAPKLAETGQPWRGAKELITKSLPTTQSLLISSLLFMFLGFDMDILFSSVFSFVFGFSTLGRRGSTPRRI